MVDRVYQRNTSDSAPQPPTDPSIGYPTGGNPAEGVPATIPGPYWYHMVTESLRRVVVGAGLEPDHINLDRLLEALQSMGLGGYATAADAQALSSLTKLLTPGTLDEAFKGGNQSLSPMGFQVLPGDFILQITQITMPYSLGFTNLPLPIAFPEQVLSILCVDAGSSASSSSSWKVNSDNNYSINIRWEPVVGDTAGSRFSFVFVLGK